MPKSACPLRPGCAYSFLYPAHNFAGILSPLEPRRLMVTAVRDTQHNPLDVATFNLQPLLKRGRWLVTGIDLDKDEERSFYVDSMLSIRMLSELEIRRQDFAVVDVSSVLTISPDSACARSFARGRGAGSLVVRISSDDQVSPPVSPSPASGESPKKTLAKHVRQKRRKSQSRNAG